MTPQELFEKNFQSLLKSWSIIETNGTYTPEQIKGMIKSAYFNGYMVGLTVGFEADTTDKKREALNINLTEAFK